MDQYYPHHLDVKNPHSFEMKDLEHLIKKVGLEDAQCLIDGISVIGKEGSHSRTASENDPLKSENVM